MTSSPRLAVAVRALAVGLPLLAAARPALAHAPTQASIVVDGEASDWALVLANPVNVTRDADGSTVPCTASNDLDCPIVDAFADVSRFAWTWDATALSVLVERVNASGPAYAVFYVDADFDGLLELREPLLALDLGGGALFA